jgi:large subunit ribosomal protein L21
MDYSPKAFVARPLYLSFCRRVGNVNAEVKYSKEPTTVRWLGLTSGAGYSQFPILVYAEFLTMYAIIDDGGRQHKVTTGDLIKIDREETDAKTITFDRVLMIGGEGEPTIGFPLVAGATVVGDVKVVKGKKIDTIKYRRRKGYHKKIGHRQTQLHVRISAINI